MPRIAHSDVRQKILAAAEERLWHYGFKKTTIDEIAADAGVGKGTVYLYFDSKEEIALAIVANYKAECNLHLEKIVTDPNKHLLDKLKEMLTYPVITAHERCQQSPAAQEMVMAVRPYIQERMRVYYDQEITLIAEVLNQGNRSGLLDLPDVSRSARTLKCMCSGFWPHFPCVEGIVAIRAAISDIVDMAFFGMQSNRSEMVGKNSLITEKQEYIDAYAG